MLFLVAGSSLAQYIKYLIAPGLQTEQGTPGDSQFPEQSLLPFQTVILAAQPEAVPGKPLLEPRGDHGHLSRPGGLGCWEAFWGWQQLCSVRLAA